MIGDRPHHRAPVPLGAAEADVEHAQQGAEGGDLRAGRHERRHRRRRALVDVGRPGLERHRADLEQQADGQHGQAEEQQPLVAAGGRRRDEHLAEVDAARVAVEQRDAVEEERGGERAEQEVLHGGLLREQAATAGEAGHEVQRQRQDLERDEHEQQVVRRREQHHPAEAEHRERVDLGLHLGRLGERGVLAGAGQHGGPGDDRAAGAVERALGDEQDRRDAEHREGALQEQRRAVDGDRVGEDELLGAGQQHRRGEGAEQADDGDDDLDAAACGARREGLDEHADERRREDDEHRRDGPVGELRGRDVGGHVVVLSLRRRLRRRRPASGPGRSGRCPASSPRPPG